MSKFAELFSGGEFRSLRPEQRAPIEALLELKPQVLVSAGAGTGKTFVLARAFAGLVLTGQAKVSEILAITFTDKAAGEMKNRLVELFGRMNREDLRREVESAYVSTIHSFAARILKENALEAGVHPDFQVATESIAEELEHETFETTLGAWFEDPERKKKLWPLLRELGTSSKLREEFLRIRPRLAAYRALGGLVSAGPDLAERGRELLRGFQHDIEVLERDFQASKINASCLQEFFEAVHRFEQVLAGRLEPDAAGLDGFNFNLPGGRAINGWRDYFKPVRDRFKERVLPFVQDGRNRPMREVLVEFSEELEEAFSKAKRAKVLLDFDDLLHSLLKFFRKGSEAARWALVSLQKKFRFLLMDELQDSNPVEMAILDELGRLGAQFLVGDLKQSIYRFRQAEPEIFRRKAGESREKKSYYCLSENRRSRPELLEVFNELFGQVVFEGSSSVAYEPLVPAPLERVRSSSEALFKPFECALAWDGSAAEGVDSKPRRQDREADWIAGKIVELKSYYGEKLRYGEIGLLLRKFTDVALYENALRRHGIPVTVVAGRGFYQKIEVLDLMGFLRVLEDPMDDIALAGVLRSPLVGLGDGALLKLLAPRPEGQRLWSVALSGLASLTVDERAPLERFLALWKELTRLKDRLGLAELLRAVILRTGYDTRVLLETDGRRKYGNIEKLIEQARDFDKRALGLHAFLAWLEEASLKELRESEAQVEGEDKSSVEILTVHKAKGLEFKVVFFAKS